MKILRHLSYYLTRINVIFVQTRNGYLFQLVGQTVIMTKVKKDENLFHTKTKSFYIQHLLLMRQLESDMESHLKGPNIFRNK